MTDPVPFTPETVPPDTDQYVYRPVTTFRGGEVVTEYMQIWIRQP